MARTARVMLAGWPFHITHRGNHRRQVFFNDSQRREYLTILRHYASRFGMSVWSYCLMKNHVHLIAMGKDRLSIARAMGNTQRTYSRRRNMERNVTGHVWANRFFSSALDETYVWTAVRYVELNPVRAGLVNSAVDYRWSSARAHAGLAVEPLLASDRPYPGPIGDWQAWLATGLDAHTAERLRLGTSTGRPCGSDEFVKEIERRLDRRLRVSRRRVD